MKKYKLTLAYDGTQYAGWQVQPNATTIQSSIENALKQIYGKPISIVGAGRTDAGVHARGQVAHFNLEQNIDENKLLQSLNHLTNPDIRILSLTPVEDDFHSRFSAKRKIYHYHVFLGRFPDPFTRLYYTLHPFDIDPSLISESLPLLTGTHDFSSFANDQHKGACAKNAVRTLYRFEMFIEKESLRFELEANGFLYKMVRNLIGLVLEIGTKKRSLDEIPHILRAKDRKQAAKAAPAQGLFLHEIIY